MLPQPTAQVMSGAPPRTLLVSCCRQEVLAQRRALRAIENRQAAAERGQNADGKVLALAESARLESQLAKLEAARKECERRQAAASAPLRAASLLARSAADWSALKAGRKRTKVRK